MICVGLQQTATKIAEFPETEAGYRAAVKYIDGLDGADQGIYYLDAPEWMVQYA